MNSKVKLIVAIVAIILVIVIVPTGIYCAVKHESPVQVVQGIFKTNEDKIIGKWQEGTGTTAYEFYEDGTYDSYLSTISYSGKYSIDGNKLTLSKIGFSNTVTYTIKVYDETLEMTLYQESGVESDDKETITYNKVDRIDTKSFDEILKGIKDELVTEENK